MPRDANYTARHPVSGGRTLPQNQPPLRLNTQPRALNTQPRTFRGPGYPGPASGSLSGFARFGGHALALLGGRENIYGKPVAKSDLLGGKRFPTRGPSTSHQLAELSGYSQLAPLAHPIRLYQHEQRLTPQQKANQAIGLTALTGGGSGRIARKAAAQGLDTSFAAFGGDLSKERLIHGAPVPIPRGIKGFSYRARNPEALLGSGVYTNNIPERPGHFAQVSPSSSRNNAPWQQARFSDPFAAEKFARKQVALGREMKHFDISGGDRYAQLKNAVTQIRGFGPGEVNEPYATGGGSQARVNSKAARRLGGRITGNRHSEGEGGGLALGVNHYLVEHRPGMAPSMLPLGVKPGTRLFDLNAPLEPGEAARAKELLIQKLKLGRAVINRDFQDDGKEDVKRWSSELLGSNTQAFDDMERLAKLHASGRGYERTLMSNDPNVRERSRLIPQSRNDDTHVTVPTGRHLHRLIDAITRGVHQPTATAYLDRVPRDQQHILDNPNSVLRQMGYQGLIDPTFNVGGEIGKEIVMFDKNRLEPFHDTQLRQNPYVKQPYPVTMAKQLARNGANFIGAVKQVRKGLMPQADLPLSDEVNLTVINLGDGKVRYFVRSAMHPDAIGKEINGAQALHLAHRSLVERRGGRLTVGQVNKALGTSAINDQIAAESHAKPAGMNTIAMLLRGQNRDLAQRYDRLYNPEKTTAHHELEQTIALGNERKAVQLRNMHALFDQGPVSISGAGGRAHLPQTWERVVKDAKTGKYSFHNSNGYAVSEDRMLELMNGATAVNGKRFNFDNPDKGALGGLKLNYREGYYPPTSRSGMREGETTPGIYIDKHGKPFWIDYQYENGQHLQFHDNGETPITDPADVRDFMNAHYHSPKVERGEKKPMTMESLVRQLKERGTELPSRGTAVRESGVVLPPEAHPNNVSHTHEGVALGNFAKPPRWYQVFHPEAVRRLLEGTPGDNFDQKVAWIDEHYQPIINDRWLAQRKAQVQDEDGSVGWQKYGMKQPPGTMPTPFHLRDAMARVKRLGLSGSEARIYIKEYLAERKRRG